MADVIDFDAYRKKRDEEARKGLPRRRKTPGGRGFDEDATSQLSVGLPGPSKDDESEPPPDAS